MTHRTHTIVDENGIEILVGYDYEHGYDDTGSRISVELTSVEVIIKGRGIDILRQLTEQQIKYVIDQLDYEDEEPALLDDDDNL